MESLRKNALHWAGVFSCEKWAVGLLKIRNKVKEKAKNKVGTHFFLGKFEDAENERKGSEVHIKVSPSPQDFILLQAYKAWTTNPSKGNFGLTYLIST